MVDDSNAPPGSFPNASFNNVTIAGAASIIGAVASGGAMTITGASATVPGIALATVATITGGSTGTLTNSPHSGAPFTFLEITVNGTTGAIPVFALS